MTWPLAIALGRLHPQSRVYYVTHAQKGALAENALRLDSTDIEAGWHELFSPEPALPPKAAKLLADSHSIFTFISDGQDLWSRNVRRLAAHATVYPLRPANAPPPPPTSAQSSAPIHASQFILEQLRPFPAVATAMAQILRSIAARGCGVHRDPDGSAAVHPGAGNAAKCWPAERFFDLAGRLRAEGRTVRIILGEIELERWPASQQRAAANAAEVITPADPLALLDVLQRASLFLGNDSGPTHLAGIIGVPTFALFGPTDPTIWSPLGPAVQTLRREPLDGRSVEEVRAWIGSSRRLDD